MQGYSIASFVLRKKKKKNPTRKWKKLPILALLSVITCKQKKARERGNHQWREATCHFFLLQISAWSSFSLGIYTSYAFSKIVTIKVLVAYCSSSLSQYTIPLCCTFMGFCSRVFCCQKPWVRVVKLNPFNNNGHSLKTSAYFYSIVCNILNLRITTALCWCHQEEVLL